MKEEAIISLLHQIGQIPEGRSGDWVNVSCPLAHLTHEKKKDENPSAGISVNEEAQSVLNCFTCGVWPLPQVLHILNWTSGLDQSIIKFYLGNEVLKEPQIETESCKFKDKFVDFAQNNEELIPVPETLFEVLDSVEKAESFLKKRGISLEVAKKHNLKTYLDGIIIPIRDFDFKTYWLKWRCTQTKQFTHIKAEEFGLDYEWGRKDSWFGLEFIDLSKPITLVESELEAMSLETLGWQNILAAHGSLGKNSSKLKRLKQLNPKVVILGFDSDQAGNRYRDIARQWLASSQIIDLDWSEVGCKDPGEIGSKEQLDRVWKKRKTQNKGTKPFKDKWRSIYDTI